MSDDCLGFSDFAVRAPDGSDARYWAPGTEAQIEITLTNRGGEPLTDYPGARVKASDPRVTFERAHITLYGLGSRQRYPLKFLAKADPAIPVGTKVTLAFVGHVRAGDRAEKDGADPVRYVAEIGMAFRQ